MTFLTYTRKTVRGLLGAALGLGLLLSGCGGGSKTTDSAAGAIESASSTGLRALPGVFTTGKSVAYSPYVTTNRDTELITDAQVKTDLQLLETAGFELIRIFDSSDKVALRTLRVIRENKINLKVMLGVYVNSFEYLTDSAARLGVKQANEDEIARGVTLAKTYASEVVAVSVGNETMVSWSFVPVSTPTMASYIKTVRDQITQPVTTDDNWAFYAGDGRIAGDSVNDVLRQIDFASVHSYAHEDAFFSNFNDSDAKPDWDWRQTGVTDVSKRAAAMMDAAINKTKQDYKAVRNFLDSNGRANMPIIIGETGWKAADSGGERSAYYKFFSHPANQKMYYLRLLDWAIESRSNNGPKGIVYFEAFDEPWKGSDDKWGLFTVDRKARCAAQALKPVANWVVDNSSSCADSAALFYAAPTLNAPVTASTLAIHNESVTGWPSDMRADAYQAGTFQLAYPQTGDSSPNDLGANLASSHYIALNTFTPASYGWGYLWQSNASPAVSANMTNFVAGSIKFSIKTSYKGKLRIGISSDTDSRVTQEAFVLVGDGQFGYCRSNAWCDVTIPVSAFTQANAALDLRYILTRFSVSDVYSATGNDGTGQTEIRLDNVYWAR